MRLICTILIFLLFASKGFADVSQSNVSGGNTSIQGGYSASTTYESGSSSSSTTTNNTTSNIRSAPNTATAPGLAPSGMDVCSVSASAGVQTFGIGISGGKSFRDENCERIKLARELKANGMSVASVALLCQDPRVFEAMIHAGTPCPYNGKIGKEASAAWTKYNKLRPDYDQYVKDLKVIKEVDEIIIEPLDKSSDSESK